MKNAESYKITNRILTGILIFLLLLELYNERVHRNQTEELESIISDYEEQIADYEEKIAVLEEKNESLNDTLCRYEDGEL